MTRSRGREAWEYPHELADDPAAAEDRRERDEGTGDPEPVIQRMVRAYWQRYAEHVAAWLVANPRKPAKARDRAEAYRIVALRYAATAGAWDVSPKPPDDLQALYAETGSPLYAWQAIAQVLDEGKPASGGALFGPSEFPYWCTQFVIRVANDLITLGVPGAPAATPENAIKVLRLFSQGAGAYGQRARRWRNQAKADLVAELIAAGMKPQRARAVAFPNIADPRTLRLYGKRIAPRVRPTGKS